MPVMETSSLTARQYWEQVKANPNRAKFGFGARPAIVNIDVQRAYTDLAAFKTAYETDPRQIEHINALSARVRALGLPVVWTYVAYLDSGEDAGDFSTSVMVVSGMLWVVYICFAMLDQMLSMMFPGDQDEDEQQEAYQQRAEGVENAGRQLASLHKKQKGD